MPVPTSRPEPVLRYLFAFLMLVHGLIHLTSFANAFGYGTLHPLTQVFSKVTGSLWFVAALLFIGATILFLLKKKAI